MHSENSSTQHSCRNDCVPKRIVVCRVWEADEASAARGIIMLAATFKISQLPDSRVTRFKLLSRHSPVWAMSYTFDFRVTTIMSGCICMLSHHA
eukprot:2947528-Pleurochrysis_carterae.AAC.2